jgi:hypothetical protein
VPRRKERRRVKAVKYLADLGVTLAAALVMLAVLVYERGRDPTQDPARRSL